MAFGVCAIITNGLLYKKPQDVETTRRILASRRPQSVRELIVIALDGPRYLFYQPRYARAGIPNNSIHIFSDFDHSSAGLWFMFNSGLAGGLFGAIHCIAWNFTFPTSGEQTIWRLMSLILIMLPLYWIRLSDLMFVERKLSPRPSLVRLTLQDERQKQNSSAFMLALGLLCYFSARLFLTVEMFRALAFASPGAFIATFTTSLPTIG